MSFGNLRAGILVASLVTTLIQQAFAQLIYTPYAFTNFVGRPGVAGFADGGGTNAQLNIPHSITIDGGGNLYVSDTFNHAIRKVTADGVMSTIAGAPSNKGYVDGVGFEEAPQFNSPIGIGADVNGNLYVADNGNQAIRKITPDGTVTLFAGKIGLKGSVNGARIEATFNSPNATAVDQEGNIFISDSVNRVIRKIIPDGTVVTFAATVGQQGTNDGPGALARFQQPNGIAVDGSGSVYVADMGGQTIRKITPGGAVSTLAGKGKTPGSVDGIGGEARFFNPEGVAVDKDGNVYVTDTANHTVRRVAPDGTVTTIAGQAGQPGNADGTNSVARFNTPRGITMDAHGIIYVADSVNSTIRKLVIQDTNCIVSTFAGSAGQNGSVDATGAEARFHFIYHLTCDSNGNIYAIDRSNDTVRKITPEGKVTTFAGAGGIPGSKDGKGAAAQFYGPEELAVDPRGNIFVIEHFNNTVRQISPTASGWAVTTIAGCATCPAGTNDGPGLSARFDGPFGFARNPSGDLFVADTGSRTIRKLSLNGTDWSVSTFAGAPKQGGLLDGTGNAARLSAPVSLTVDKEGTLFVCDGERIRKITAQGSVSTIAGGLTLGAEDGPGSTALFNLARGITVDVSGNIYVADSPNQLIRRLAPTGANYNVTTVAGSPGVVGTADGVGPDARFNQPTGVVVDHSGKLYVVDSAGARITNGDSPDAGPDLAFDLHAISITSDALNVRVSGPVTASVITQTSTNLVSWLPLRTNTFSAGTLLLTLPLKSSGMEFYRLRLAP